MPLTKKVIHSDREVSRETFENLLGYSGHVKLSGSIKQVFQTKLDHFCTQQAN